MSDCCNEFSRSSLLRRAAAEAGVGLPAIEPGMPLPAGTGLDRRSFIARSVGLALAVYGAGALGPRFLDEGIADALAAGPANPVLVSVFMDGGVDSLSLLFPHGDPDYRRLRPKLALPDSGLGFSEDERLRWHPSATGFATLHQEGKLSVLPAIGYRDADQSHFTSRHYWEVGATDAGVRTGWLGRYLDRTGSRDNPLQGLSLDGELAPSLATAKVPVAALRGADEYSFWAPGVWGQVEARMLDAIGALGVMLRRSPLIVLLSLEIMLNGANLALITFSRHHGELDGQIFALAVMAVAASEVVVGLGLIVAVHRRKLDLDVDKLSTLRG